MRISADRWLRMLTERPAIVSFLIATFWFFCLHKAYSVITFPHDAGNYWELSRPRFIVDPPAGTIRGYFFPATLAPLRFISDRLPVLGLLPYRVATSFAYAFALAVVLPYLVERLITHRAIGLARRLIVPLLVGVFFPGLIIYPLSDLPALSLLICAAGALVAANEIKGRQWKAPLVAGGGFFAYGAYNTRTIYVLAAMLLLFGLLTFLVENRTANRARMAAFFILGGLIACVPQMAFNEKAHGRLSPAVIANTSATHSLFASQLLWGITLQKYETSVDPDSPSPALFYLDPAGERLFQEADVDGASFGVGDYLTLLVTHPMEFVGIYGRHFINGLDVRDGEVYTGADRGSRNLVAFANFCVIFLGGLLLLNHLIKHSPTRRPEAWFWIFCMLTPVLAVLPSAIETRFFLPLHLVLYSAIAFSDRAAIRVARPQWAFHAIMFLLCLSIFYGVSQSTLAGLRYEYAAIYRGY